MKKTYVTPELSTTPLNSVDVIKTSGEAPSPSNRNDYTGEWDKEL